MSAGGRAHHAGGGRGGVGSPWENELLLALPFLFSYRLVLTITSFFVPYLWAK